jgi:glycyl-tRNA synthetase beta chain
VAALATRAARLAKADLVSATVGEFPELQGQIGRYLALSIGEDPAVADAIRDHYKPVGQGDDVPTAAVSVAVALADKLDTLVGFFALNQKPTGSKDPYALRRAMLGIVATILHNNLFLDFGQAVKRARNEIIYRLNIELIGVDVSVFEQGELKTYPYISDKDVSGKIGFFPVQADKYSGDGSDGELIWHEAYAGPHQPAIVIADEDTLVGDLVEFALDRLRVRLRDEGVDAGVVRAFVQEGYKAAQLPDGEELIARLSGSKTPKRYSQPLQFVQTVASVRQAARVLQSPAGLEALAAYRRVTSILGSQQPIPADVGEFDAEEAPASFVLDHAVRGLTIELQMLVAARNYERAIAEIGKLKPLIDKFFDQVMVNDPDPAIRARRLALLARFRDAVHGVADFSKIEG